MAEPEVEAAWRAEFERSGVTQIRDALGGGGLADEKTQAAFRWLGDEAEARRQAGANLPLYQVDILDCRRCCDRRCHCAGFVVIALRCRQSGRGSDAVRCLLSGEERT